MKRSFYFVCSERSLAFCLILLLSGSLALLFCAKRLLRGGERAAVKAEVVQTDENDGAVIARHLRFLAECGWEAEGPAAVEAVEIPARFGPVYETYNRLQLAEGCDLSPFAGKTVTKYVYTVKNHPAAAADETVLANVLEADGRIVGGDICSTAMNGFMHGFHGETDGYDQTG